MIIPENDLERFGVLELAHELMRRGYRVERQYVHMTVYPPLNITERRKRSRVVGIAQPDDPAIAYGLCGPATSEELPQ